MGSTGNSGNQPNLSSSELFDTYQNDLESYVMGDTYYINYALRNEPYEDVIADEDNKDIVTALDAATSGKLNYTGMLYRGTDLSSLFEDASAADVKQLANALLSGNLNGAQTKLVENALSKNHIEKGYMSTTADINVAKNIQEQTGLMPGMKAGSGVNVVLNIKPNANTKGIDISAFDNMFEDTPQKERLLARNQKYKLSKLYAKNGVIYADVKLI